MANSNDDWSCDANKAVRVSLVRTQPSASEPNLETIHQFHPNFTYPIFGEEERIFGYDGLEIDLRFAAHDCRPEVVIKYKNKFVKVGDVQATDCEKVLRDFMPPPAFKKTPSLEQTLRDDEAAGRWTPPGEKIHSYQRDGRTFELWGGSLSDLDIRHLLDQIQIFILFFIEGGQMLPLDDPEWTLSRWYIYFLYEKQQVPDQPNISPYVLAGYTTTYRYWTFIKPTSRPANPITTSLADLESIDLTRQNCRLRIAQFVILPPYQSSGHGTVLYQTIYRLVMADPTIVELTVEDPSEEFDKLRDVNDWKVLEPAFRSANIKINIAAVATQHRHERMPKRKLLDMVQLEKMRKAHKIAPRQFYRAMELYFLAQIPYSHRAAGGASLTRLLVKKHRSPEPVDVKYYWLRNIIKQRIWRQNQDKFQDIPPTEVVDLVNDTSRGQEDEYEGYLLRFAAKASAESNGQGISIPSAIRKRKIIDEDDDDDGAMSDASKKARGA